jgi:hypothetical protein
MKSYANPERSLFQKKAIKTNKERYSERKLKAYDYWYTNQCTGIHLSEIFKVSFSSACGWIREWKKERAETIARAST